MRLGKCEKFHPDCPVLKGYIVLWPFECEICSGCGECLVDWPRWKTILWQFTIGWWWDGRVRVDM